MNDSVLRGFCRHLSVFQYSIKSYKWLLDFDHNPFSPCGVECEITGVLSPNQMKILEVRPEIWEYEGFADMLEKNPFLVAGILAKAGKEKGADVSE